MQMKLLLQHGKEEVMIVSIIEIATGLALFYGTGVAIAKTVMFLNPDPLDAPYEPGVND